MTIACDVAVLNIVTKVFSYVFVIVWICFMFRNTSKRGESFGISRIGSKIKGVFKSTTMEGAMLPSYGLAEGEDDMVRKCMLGASCVYGTVLRRYIWLKETNTSYCLIDYLCFPPAPSLTFGFLNGFSSLSCSLSCKYLSKVVTVVKFILSLCTEEVKK